MAFDRYYREVHIPLGKKLPGLRRYTPTRNATAIRDEAFYLVAGLDRDNLDALGAACAPPEGRDSGHEVEHLPHSGSRRMIVEFEEI